MKILKKYDLAKLNTFGIKAKAEFFVEIKNEEDLKELFFLKEFKKNEKLFLGGGSNVLFTKDFGGIVVLNKLKGIEILKEDDKNIWIKSMGGELWNDLVNFCVKRNFWGVENLSLIPGTVGATPVQNIGAYGVEVKDVIDSVEAYDIKNGEKKIFQNTDCAFGYRDSIFKNKLKGKYFISAVIFKLSKIPNLNIKHKALKDYLEKPARNAFSRADAGGNKIVRYSPKDISDAVAEIRKSKLPNPKILGNAGSFFKNVYISSEKLEELKKNYPDILYFEEEGAVKIPAGWLIEKCGPRQGGASWKGYRQGNVGVHDKQALVLVNYGGATGKEVKDLADQIAASVFEKFGLKLEPEVNLY